MSKPPHNAAARLSDIIEAIDVIHTEVAGIDLQAFTRDLRKCWVVERGLEIIAEAGRRLPEEFWRVVHDELPKLETVCRTELASIT